MPDLKSVLGWSALAAGVAIAAERQLSKALADPAAPVLDWELVRRTAYARCGGEGATEAEEVGDAYDPLVAELVPMLAEACNTPRQAADFGRVRVVSRYGFIDQNLEMMKRLLKPLVEGEVAAGRFRPSPLMRVPSSLYVGALLGFMAHRVLGQYDPVLSFLPQVGEPEEPAPDLPTPALLIVESNVRQFAESSHLELDPLRRWLMLHELTHAWQFELHPWLRPHLTSLIRELSRLPGPTQVLSPEQFVQTLRGLRPQLLALGRVQAVMTVLEGHGNFIMREAGRRHLPDFDTLDQAFHRRHEQHQAAERLLLLISGVAFKLQQYQQGERFLRRVQEVSGQPGLDLLWTGPDAFPGWGEVRRPERWLERQGLDRRPELAPERLPQAQPG